MRYKDGIETNKIKWVRIDAPDSSTMEWLTYSAIFITDPNGNVWVSQDQGMTFIQMNWKWRFRHRIVLGWRKARLWIRKRKSSILWPWIP